MRFSNDVAAHGAAATPIAVLVAAACDTRTIIHSDQTKSESSQEDTGGSTSTTRQRGANTSRDRMKQEMRQLRDSVQELQRQVDELKRDHSKTRAHVSSVTQSGDPAATRENEPSAAQLSVAWEAMARGQCEQRYKAEVVNVKLRTLLDEQIKVAHTLERILSKRRSVEQLLGTSQSRKKRPRAAALCPIHQPSVFSDLESSLASLYLQTDAVLRKQSFLRRDGQAFREVDVRHSDEIGPFVEATERRLVPFPQTDTAQATWEYFVHYPHDGPRNDPAKKLPTLSHDVLRRDVDIAMQLVRFTGHIHGKFVARRFVEMDREVIVWVALIDPSDMGDAAVEGLVVRHTGWMCTRPAPSSSDAMSELLVAQLSVPEVYDHSAHGKRRVCTLTNFLVSSMAYQLDTHNRIVDNILLERSLARAKQRK